MDPIDQINIKKDSSFAILLEAQKRKYNIYYMELHNLYLKNNKAYAKTKILFINNTQEKHFHFVDELDIPLSNLDVIFMRKDPPVNMEFIYATYILEHAEQEGVLIVNKPSNLRNCNEKIYTTYFPDLIPDTLISQNNIQIKNFINKHQDVIIKPLNAMGGNSIFRIQILDPNVSVIIETMTKNNTHFCLVQQYLPDIIYGDKRIIIIDGQPIPLCLARIPPTGETRGNLAAGGIGKVQKINENDFKIAKILSPFLIEKGLIIVGIDVIGTKLTEINITSPTCICEIQTKSDICITKLILNAIEKKLDKK